MCYGSFTDRHIERPAVTDLTVKFYFGDMGLYIITSLYSWPVSSNLLQCKLVDGLTLF